MLFSGTYLALQKKSNAADAWSKAPMYLSRHAIRMPDRDRPFEQCTMATWSLRRSSQLLML